jgi:hypothetical protein
VGRAVSRVLFRSGERDGHLSGTAVAGRLEQPTRGSPLPVLVGVGHTSPPIWPCSDWGLPCHRPLPAVRWALTPPFHPYHLRGGLFSVALSVAFRRPGVTWQSTRWSSDFPRASQRRPRPSRSTRRKYTACNTLLTGGVPPSGELVPQGSQAFALAAKPAQPALSLAKLWVQRRVAVTPLEQHRLVLGRR